MSLVALSGSYGAGGGRVGRALADRLGVPFVDRAIPAAVAAELAVPLDDAQARDERVSSGWLERLLSGFIGQDATLTTPAVSDTAMAADDFRRATEAVLREQASSGRGVILGRAGAILLRDDPRVLRARLDGPAEARVRQAMAAEGIDEATARERQRQLDRAHATYARHFYGVDARDPALYHLVLDSTALPLELCVELLAAAAAALARQSAGGA